MYRPEMEAARGMAYMHARDELSFLHVAAWRWATEHWPEFIANIDADPTGQMLFAGYQQINRFRQA